MSAVRGGEVDSDGRLDHLIVRVEAGVGADRARAAGELTAGIKERVGVTVDWYARATEQGLRSAMLPVVVLERRLHLANNGLRERESRAQYLHVLKAALDRRRAQADPDGPAPGASGSAA